MNTAAKTTYDVVIIGGGASGLAAAFAAARAGGRVLVIEANAEAGLPILATGNGRCNISAKRIDPARYHNPDAARALMGPAPEKRLERFFAEVGIVTTTEDNRLYPYSKRAESVRDALLAAVERAGAAVLCGAEVTSARFVELPPQGEAPVPTDPTASIACTTGTASRPYGTWQLTVTSPTAPLRTPRKTDGHARLRALRRALKDAPRQTREIGAQAVVIACGGASERIAALFDLPHRAEQPMLCPVACTPCAADTNALTALDGVRVEGALTLYRNGSPCWHEDGEVLFRIYGISGVVAFNLSRRAQAGDIVEVDLFPQRTEDGLAHLFAQRAETMGVPLAIGAPWYHGLLAAPVARLVECVAAHASARPLAAQPCAHPNRTEGTAPLTPVKRATKNCGGHAAPPAVTGTGVTPLDATAVARTAKHLAFRIAGTADERVAQVRRGGIPLSAVDATTLQMNSDIAPQLFACGEALDQDADCGGFNLAWAWLSGLAAGTSAAQTTTTREAQI